jgi:hypothetical protein
VLVVHQDPLPGIRQDWLVRPIPRRDLFFAKLLFVLLFVQGPWWLVDLLQGVANGFGVGQSAATATSAAANVLVHVSIPVLAFAALTATMTETLIGAVGVLAVLVAFLVVPGVTHVPDPTGLTGLAWVADLTLLFLAGVLVLTLQYGRRQTTEARALFAVAVIAGQFVGYLPFATAFRLQQAVTASSGDERRIAVAFAPEAGRYRLAPGQGVDDIVEKPGVGAVDVAEENQRRRAEGARTVFLPIHVSGLIMNSRLFADRADVRVFDRSGDVIHHGVGNDLEIRPTGTDSGVHQGIRIPGTVYARLHGEPVDVQIDYSFTLFLKDMTYSVPARGGDQQMPGVGRCATRIDDPGVRVLFQCINAGERPQCLAVQLEHTPTGARNPEVSMCVPDYSPVPGHTFPDAYTRFNARLPFYDPSGGVRYPVGGPQLADARVLVSHFEPTMHFGRTVTAKAIRLQDWEPESQSPAAAR